MQAITTRVLPPTDTRGARIVAECDRGRLVMPYPDGNQEQAHRAVCQAMLDKFAGEDVKEYGRGTKPEDHHWGPFVSGQTKGGDWVHVLVGRGAVVVPRETVAELVSVRSDIKQGGCRGGIGMGRIALALEAVIGGDL